MDTKNTNMDFELRKLEFEKSLALRSFEIDNFWKRGWFFGAFLVALVSGYILLINYNHTYYCIYVSFIGFIVSLAQSLMNRGSKFWQERYEYKTKHLETALNIDVTKISRYNDNERYYLDSCILSKGSDNLLTRSRRFSVSKLTFLVWDIITITWLLIWIHECHFNFSQIGWKYVNMQALVFHAVIIGYIIFFCWGNKNVYEGFLTKSNKMKATNDERRKDSKAYIDNHIM